jgi:hypothetical protein
MPSSPRPEREGAAARAEALKPSSQTADNEIVSDEEFPSPGPFRYHLELSPAQLKITHTALHSLLDDFGHDQSDVHAVIRQVLDKLPDEHAMRAVRLDDELERELGGAEGPAKLDRLPEGPDDEGPPAA